MSKKTRKRLPVQEKAAILRLHLLEHTPISDLCDRYGIHPTMFYRWQKELFENAAAALEPRTRRAGDDKDRRIAALEQKLQRKNEVLSELMEEHIELKKATTLKLARTVQISTFQLGQQFRSFGLGSGRSHDLA